MKLRCYCCGDKLDKKFALVSMSKNSVDRVFIMKTEHVDRADAVEAVIVTIHNGRGA